MGMEMIGFPSKYNSTNMDNLVKSMGKDFVDKLLSLMTTVLKM